MKRSERQLSRAMKGEFRRLAKDILLAMLPTYLEMHNNIQVDNTLVMDAHRLAEQMFDHPPRKFRAHDYGDIRMRPTLTNNEARKHRRHYAQEGKAYLNRSDRHEQPTMSLQEAEAVDGEPEPDMPEERESFWQHDPHCEYMMGDGPCDCGAFNPDQDETEPVLCFDPHCDNPGCEKQHPRDRAQEDGHTNTERSRAVWGRSSVDRRVSEEPTRYKGRRKADRRNAERIRPSEGAV